jgi:DNA-binding NtrC family response regulator
VVRKNGRASGKELALIVHPDMGHLSAMQNEFSSKGISCVVARDLPTALLALTQHSFTLVLIASEISEKGDGMALGGVVRMIFEYAYIAVLSDEMSVRSIQAAINNGLNHVFENRLPPTVLVESILAERDPGGIITSQAVQ